MRGPRAPGVVRASSLRAAPPRSRIDPTHDKDVGGVVEPSISIKTEIPGPRSREWIARKEAVVAEAKSLWIPVFVDRAEGATLTDVDGNRFIDLAGGIGCLAVGHANPAVNAAVHAQVDRFLHTDFTILP